MAFAEAVKKAGGDTLDLCYQCGTCTASCPSGRRTSFRTRQIIRKAQLGLKDEVLKSEELWMCTTCYSCVERCPREVEIVDIILLMRNMSVQAGNMAEAHKKIGANLLKIGATVPFGEDMKKLRSNMGLPANPPTTVGNQKAQDDLVKIMKKTGFDKLMGGN
ncbi:MAG: CoB--CoM heterodisulfide reductase iron-sulfur subunit C [Methanomassiliicoccales archaeon PtaU1.Bin124]|nr:MAG: CoB--CoM heterodisulfide reductase iron-sulfur subunit C [Methanomassiliicoccales archaeon PtaU1.Bin124]